MKSLNLMSLVRLSPQAGGHLCRAPDQQQAAGPAPPAPPRPPPPRARHVRLLPPVRHLRHRPCLSGRSPPATHQVKGRTDRRPQGHTDVRRNAALCSTESRTGSLFYVCATKGKVMQEWQSTFFSLGPVFVKELLRTYSKIIEMGLTVRNCKIIIVMCLCVCMCVCWGRCAVQWAGLAAPAQTDLAAL